MPRSNGSPTAASEGGGAISLRRKSLFAFVVLVSVWAFAEGAARLWLAVDESDRWTALGDVLVAAGFEQLQTILEPDEQRFWRARPDLDTQRLTGSLGNSRPIAFTVSTNELGHRAMSRVPDATQDVLFLGDSCTFGVGVEGDETFAALLQGRFARARSINAAVPGYTAYQGRVTLETLHFDRPPSAVVVSFMFNDDLPWDGRSDLEHARDRARFDNWLLRHSSLVQMLVALRGPGAALEPGTAHRRPRLNDAEYASELGQIVDHARSLGAEVILMAWPIARQMANDRVTRKQIVMSRVAKAKGVPFVDLIPHFRKQEAPMFVDAVHANVAGNRLVADLLEPEIRGLLSR
ncbi:MAG: GDSL-type esterase/lipase family protein [Myxococcota bacterium]|jgi:lysophospholipase L1-like esterase|nr:GDSL-type esterase/lipase family protein [Myxococcota bacterium]